MSNKGKDTAILQISELCNSLVPFRNSYYFSLELTILEMVTFQHNASYSLPAGEFKRQNDGQVLMNTDVFPEAVCQVNLITNTCFCPIGSNLHMLLLKEVSALATAHLEKSYKLSTKK